YGSSSSPSASSALSFAWRTLTASGCRCAASSVARSAASSSFSINPQLSSVGNAPDSFKENAHDSGYTFAQSVTGSEFGAILERTVHDLLGEIEALPADVLYREPVPGEWPVMSTLAHLAELLPYWAHEAADLARSPGKDFGRTHDDPRRLGAIAQHGHD